MKKSLKVASMALALMLAISALGLPAVADYSSDDIRVRRVTMEPRTLRIPVGEYGSCVETLDPSDARVWDEEWTSSDEDVATVDSNGSIKAISPGTAEIRYRVNRGPYGICTVTVPGKPLNDNTPDADKISRSREIEKRSEKDSVVEKKDKISTTTVVEAVEDAKALKGSDSVRFINYNSISASTIKAAANANKNATLNFDTKVGKVIEGRVTIRAAQNTKLRDDIQLGVYTNSDVTEKTHNKFAKKYSNDLAVIKCEHSGSFDTTVRLAAKISFKGMDKNNLHFYTYNSKTGKLTKLSNTNYSTDTKSYVYLDTSYGDYIIVSDGALK